MLYTFKSKATGDVLMLGPKGDEMLRVIGMEPSAQGILPATNMPAAIEAIKAAIAQEHARLAKTVIDPARDDDPAAHPGIFRVPARPAVTTAGDRSGLLKDDADEEHATDQRSERRHDETARRIHVGEAQSHRGARPEVRPIESGTHRRQCQHQANSESAQIQRRARPASANERSCAVA